MKRALILLPLAALCGAAQAGTYTVLQDTDCPIVSKADLAGTVRKAGAATGLDLPKDMALRTELRCAIDGKTAAGPRYVYTFRASIERQVSDGEHQRWMPVAHHTGFGTATGSAAVLKQVGFTVRDVIRQEP
jgi:hypothetical protein